MSSRRCRSGQTYVSFFRYQSVGCKLNTTKLEDAVIEWNLDAIIGIRVDNACTREVVH